MTLDIAAPTALASILAVPTFGLDLMASIGSQNTHLTRQGPMRIAIRLGFVWPGIGKWTKTNRAGQGPLRMGGRNARFSN